MKFEEALAELRKGKKIRHPNFEEDEYFMGCYVSLMFMNHTILKATENISIVKMKGEKQHPDMKPRIPFLESFDLCKKYPFLKSSIMQPQLNLLLVMSDDWEILE